MVAEGQEGVSLEQVFHSDKVEAAELGPEPTQHHFYHNNLAK